MPTTAPQPLTRDPPPQSSRWLDSQRVERWAGEIRVNFLRLIALVCFYGHHLINVYVLGDAAAGGDFHLAVSALVLAWAAEVMLLYFCLSRRWTPAWLPYAAVGWDLLMITGLVALTGDPRHPLAALYFVVIASSTLRLSFPIVYEATLGAMAGYLLLVGYYAFFLIGADTYYASPELRIPRTHEVIFILALGAAGLMAGQAVRQARRLAQGYPITVEPTPEN